MTDFLLLYLCLFIAYAEQIFAACLIGVGMTLFVMGLGITAFTFWLFK